MRSEERRGVKKRNISIIVLLALIIVSLGTYFAVQFVNAQTVKEQLTLGNKFYEEQKYEEAIIAFETVLEIEPENVDARVGLANSYKALEKVVEARKVLIAGIEITPKEPSVYLALSDIQMEEDDVADAVSTLDKGLDNTGDKEIQSELQEIGENIELISDRDEVQIDKTAQLKIVYYKQTKNESTVPASKEEKKEESKDDQTKQETEEENSDSEIVDEKDTEKAEEQPDTTVKEVLVKADWYLNPGRAAKLKEKKAATNVFTALKPGDEKVIATIGSIEKTRDIHVKDQVLEDLEIVASMVKTTAGKEIQLKAIGKDANGKEMDVSPEWSIVDGVGKLKLKKGQSNTFVSDEEGSSTIEAVVDRKKFAITLDIEEATFTLSKLVAGNGSIELSPVGNEFKSGETVTLKAIAANGWEFVGWEGVSSDSPSTSILINENTTVRAIFKQKDQYFPLQVNKVGQGTVTTSPSSEEYKEGTKVLVTATANDGWQFDHWEGNASGSNPEIQVTMDNAKEITAVFVEEKVSYTLNTKVEGNGSVKRSPLQNEYDKGTVVTLTAIPETGWELDHWEGNASGNNPEIQVTMDSAKNIRAVFVEKKVAYTLTTAVEGNGSVKRSPLQNEYDKGTVVTLTAIPKTGWKFDHWEGNAQGKKEQITVTMNESKQIKAVFVEEYVVHPLSISTEGQGTVEKSPDQESYREGQMITLKAVPAEGWEFDHWEGSVSGNNPTISLVLDGAKVVKAVFVKKKAIYTLSTTVEGKGVIQKSPSQSKYEEGTVVSLTAVPEAGWLFDHWEGDVQGNKTQTTVKMNSTKAVKAVFVEEVKYYDLSIEIVGQGTVSKDPDQSTYEEGQQIHLTAVPANGWQFDHWEQDITATSHVVSLTMNTHKTIRAVFVKEKVKYKLETTVSGEGTITRNPAGEEYEEGSNVTLTATPSTGWVFQNWSGALTGSESQKVLHMDSPKQVEAIFIQTGQLHGVVKNARNGQVVSGASVQLRKGENVQTGSIHTSTISDANGNFSIGNLIPGKYTIEIAAENYTSKFSNVEIVSGQTTTITESIMPITGDLTEFQVVLNWGATPEDLDAHLTGPLADGTGRFHIYFGNKQYTDDGLTYAQLDTDVTTGGGPETVTTFKQVDGIYRYFVRNFTGTPSITTSNARVELYKEGRLIRTFYVPTIGDGLYWHVFEIENGVLREINKIANEGMQ